MRNNLIEFRKKIGMSQEELGSLANKKKQYVWFVEQGKRKGSVDFWLSIQKKFKLSFEEIDKLMEVS